MLRQEIRVDVVTAPNPVELEVNIISALTQLRDNPVWEFEVQSVQYAGFSKTVSTTFGPEIQYEYSALIFYKMWPVIQVQQQ